MRNLPENHTSWTEWHRRLGHLNMQQKLIMDFLWIKRWRSAIYQRTAWRVDSHCLTKKVRVSKVVSGQTFGKVVCELCTVQYTALYFIIKLPLYT